MTEARGEGKMGVPDATINDPDDTIGAVVEGGGVGSGERVTGTPNTIYDLSSVLFHALQGGASYDTYVEDAEREGDEELTEFFRRVREEDRDRAAEARLLLAERTPAIAGTEDTVTGVVETEGSEFDVSPGTELSGGLPDTEPRAEGVPSGDARREDVVAEMPDEDLSPPEEAVPPDAPGPTESSSRAEAEQPPRTEPISAPSGPGDVSPRRTGEAAAPRPEPSSDFPGTEPVEGEDPTARSGKLPPPPEEVPPERAGEIPMAEEVPAPRSEEIPTEAQTQASTADVGSPVPGDIPHEDMVPPTPPPPIGMGKSQTAEEEGAGQQEEDRGLIDRLTDRVRDRLAGEEEQRGEGEDRPGRR